MNAEFASVWKAVGWSSFAEISELGLRDLTILFLCTLVETDIGISFRFFGREFSLSWKELSTILGFHHKCSVDIEHVTHGYPIKHLHTHKTWTGWPTREEIQHNKGPDTSQVGPESSPTEEREGRWAQLDGRPTTLVS